jgi:DNA-binding LacI/PurR family transcriptional regulator
MSGRARVTLRDIAHQANVSVSTVSRALNNHEYVDEETRQAIYRVADSLGYPLENLRTTTPDADRTIVVISLGREGVQRSVDDFDFLVYDGARLELEARGFSVSRLHDYNPSLSAESENWQKAVSASGVLWVGGVIDRDFLSTVQSRQVPLVVAGGHVLPLHINNVMANYVYGTMTAVDHLSAQGKKNIGLVNGPPTTATSAEKVNGLCAALCRHNLPFSTAQIAENVTGWFDAESGYQQTFALLDQFPQVDAIIYAGDEMAMGGLTALKEKGYRIPDDIAVIGFHNFEISRFTDPPLTTVGFDMRLMGRIAAQRLCTIIEQGEDACWTVLVPTELVVRNSA